MDTIRKHSKKRDAILNCLRETDAHPSAEWVYSRLKPQIPDLSLGTVYRNLALFKETGEAISLGTVMGLERFDGRTDPHIHFVCTRCGRSLPSRRRMETPKLAAFSPVPPMACGPGCRLA